MKTDIEIQQDVINQLRWDPLLNAAEIGVTAKNGIVTLYGQVDSYAKKMAAEKAARKAPGVRALAEDIQISVFPHEIKTDSEMAEMVLNAYKSHPSLPHKNIQVTVDEGIVTLEGEVGNELQRREAYQVVADLSGVRMIFNQLAIKPPVSFEEAENWIRHAVQRTSSIDPNNINAIVEGNRILLHGKVRTHIEKEEAEEAAWSIPGITAVENHLKLITEQELEC